MRAIFFCLFALLFTVPARAAEAAATNAPAAKRVFVIPVREEFDKPLLYVVRRGVKEAIAAGATLIVLDIDSPGGRLDVLLDIIKALDQFPGATASYVNKNALSAGAMLAFGTQKIYMAPQSVIGAAAPVMATAEGGASDMPGTMEAKMASAVSAMIRSQAERHGHDIEVVDAMVKKTKELKKGDTMLNEKGQLLSLTNVEAERKYGTPPRPLLSLGTVKSLDKLMDTLGHTGAPRTEVTRTGAEKLGYWINVISPLLIALGMMCIYAEMKTPGFGAFGITAIVCFSIYFIGGYVAGLSGMEWLLVFLLGAALLAVELFLVPGTFIAGGAGVILMLVSIVMALADVYPSVPRPDGGWMPAMPRVLGLREAMETLLYGMAGAVVAVLLAARYLPRTALYGRVVSTTASGEASVVALEKTHAAQVGLEGVALSPLRPGGKAQFGDRILDVVTQGEMLAKGDRVRIVRHSGAEAVVEKAG